jgi:hypothetical protein
MSPESAAQLPAPTTTFPQAWRTVSFGTVCLSAGAVLFVAGFVIVSLLIACNIQLRNEPRIEGMESSEQELPSILIVSSLLVFVTGAMVWLAGLCMLCVAPPESGARWLAASAAACWFLFLVVALQIPMASVGVRLRTPRFVEQGRQHNDAVRMTYGSDNGAALAAAMLAIAGGGLTLACLCAIAHRFQNEALASSTRRLLLFQVLALPVMLFLFFLHHYIAGIWRHLPWYLDGPPFLFAAFALAIAGCVWLLRVFAETRRMLRTAEEIANESPG